MLYHLSNLSVPKLRYVVEKVLTQETYKNNASRLQKAIALQLADIIERIISKHS